MEGPHHYLHMWIASVLGYSGEGKVGLNEQTTDLFQSSAANLNGGRTAERISETVLQRTP